MPRDEFWIEIVPPAVRVARILAVGAGLAVANGAVAQPFDGTWNQSLERAGAFPAPPPNVERDFHPYAPPAYRVAQDEGARVPPPVAVEDPTPQPMPMPASPSDRPTSPLAQPPGSSILQTGPTEGMKPGPAWSLETLEDVALQRNPAIAEASARVEAARGEWIQAGLPPNLVAGYAASEIGDDGNAGQQGLFVAQEFVRGGKLSLAQQVAAQRYMQAQCELEAMRWRALTDVRRAYYVYRIALRRLDVARRLIDISSRSAELTRALVEGEGGELRGVDLLQAQTDLARAEVAQARLAVAADGRLRELEAVTGGPLGAAPSIDGDLTAPPQIAWDATLARIERENPLMAAAQAEIERAGWSIQYEQAQVIPNLDAQVQIQHDFATDDPIVGLQLSGPIPLWNQNQGNVHRAFAERRQAQQRLERLRLSLAQQLAGEFRQFEASRLLVDRYDRDVLPKTERAVDLSRQALEGGEGNFLDLLTAQRTYFQTTLEYLDALEEMWIAYARIDGFLLDGSLTAER